MWRTYDLSDDERAGFVADAVHSDNDLSMTVLRLLAVCVNVWVLVVLCNGRPW